MSRYVEIKGLLKSIHLTLQSNAGKTTKRVIKQYNTSVDTVKLKQVNPDKLNVEYINFAESGNTDRFKVTLVNGDIKDITLNDLAVDIDEKAPIIVTYLERIVVIQHQFSARGRIEKAIVVVRDYLQTKSKGNSGNVSKRIVLDDMVIQINCTAAGSFRFTTLGTKKHYVSMNFKKRTVKLQYEIYSDKEADYVPASFNDGSNYTYTLLKKLFPEAFAAKGYRL